MTVNFDLFIYFSHLYFGSLSGFYSSRYSDGKTKGIVHQTSAPYTPQQNGRAKRIFRTLLERARVILLASQLPKEFWAAAVQVAAVLHNYTPAAEQKLTANELFHGFPPDTTRLRVFGCKAYAMIPKERRK
jgi:transposase InsO family protein